MKKLKRQTFAVIVMLLCVSALISCAEVVSEKPIDVEYVAAYDAMETVYSYKYDWLNGDWKYLPEYKMVHHEAEYKVQYEAIWSNGEITTYWENVDKQEYEQALDELEGDRR